MKVPVVFKTIFVSALVAGVVISSAWAFSNEGDLHAEIMNQTMDGMHGNDEYLPQIDYHMNYGVGVSGIDRRYSRFCHHGSMH